jgi:Htaa protein
VKRAGAALALGVATAAVAAAPAAAQGTGTTTIAPKGKAVKSLRSQGVTIGTFGPARARRGRLVLPVDGGLVGSTATLNQNGGLRLTRRAGGKRRRVDLKRLQLRLGRRSEIVGFVGTSRFTIFSVKAPASRLSLSPANGSASLKGGSVTLTRRAGKALKRKLKLRRMPLGAFGTISVDALVNPASGPGAGSGGGPGGGGPGGGPPTTGPISDEPPVLARPDGAADITSASITWYPKPSWIRYSSSEQDPTPFGGASADPPTNFSACPEPSDSDQGPLLYSFHFPFTGGWYHGATDTAGVYFGGGVNFKFPSHNIDLDTKEPEIEINGPSSRTIFRFDGRGGTRPGNKRAVLADLNTAAAPPARSGNTITYTRIPATIPQGTAQSVFAGFYAPGDRFGCMSVSFTYAGP